MHIQSIAPESELLESVAGGKIVVKNINFSWEKQPDPVRVNEEGRAEGSLPGVNHTSSSDISNSRLIA